MSTAYPEPHDAAINGRRGPSSQATNAPDQADTEDSRAVAGSEAANQPNSPRAAMAASKLTHQRFVFTDPVAFRYLEEDPSTTVLDRRHRLEGYELYMVEQWACSRVHPTFVITTFTGDPAHSVLASVLSVPTNEDTWSPRLRVYFKAVSQFHARPKETPLGMLMVTNLSGFPSALTVIAVPGGDVKAHREDFIVNENLKRMGCSGRAGLNLSTPSGATQAKFHQLYKTSDRISFYDSVIELVRLCQVALMLFGKLGPEYADGLLCDVTERGINDWWTELGTDFYDTEPGDGILGPTTVAALLGLLMGARNRLNAYGAPVGKDAFDVAGLKRGVAYFQKSLKLSRTRRLDRPTHSRLCKATSRVANGEGWMVPKGVKSTVAELSGKGGEMVMGMVGARDKIGIAEIETMDFERFVQLAYGERARWLWHGKPRKSLTHELFSPITGEDNPMFGRTLQSGQTPSTKRRDSIEADRASIDNRQNEDDNGSREWSTAESAMMGDSPPDKDGHLRKAVLKSVTGKMTDARSGFGRIKGAVGIPGLRGHQHKPSKDGTMTPNTEDGTQLANDRNERQPSVSAAKFAPPSNPPSAPRSEADVPTESAEHSTSRRGSEPGVSSSSSKNQSQPMPAILGPRLLREITASFGEEEGSPAQGEPPLVDSPGVDESLVAMDLSERARPSDKILRKDFEELFQDENRHASKQGTLLRRTQSTSRFMSKRHQSRNDAWWPRHLSFSDAETAVLRWDDISLPADEKASRDIKLSEALTREELLSQHAKRMHDHILEVEDEVGWWVQQKLQGVEAIHDEVSRSREELTAVYYQRLEDYQTMRGDFTGLLGEERTHLTEAVRDVEVLGAKLEYEVNALGLKVDDVEDSVAEFERLVLDVEGRAQALEVEDKVPESWLHWGTRMVLGGTKDTALTASAPK